MTKIECPICKSIGYLEQRGESFRIKHYIGFENGKRKYVLHKVVSDQIESLGINGNQSLGINNLESNASYKREWTGGDLNPEQSGDITRDCLFS